MAAGPDTTASPAAPSAPPPRCWCSWLIALLFLLPAACTAKPAGLPARIDAAVARGAAFLISKQGPDGAIRSPVYAYFKDGYALTPLALAALFALPEESEAYARGVDFIATMVKDGALRDDVDAPRYPLYSMAIGVLVLNRPGNERQRAARDALVRAILARQLVEAQGWKPDHPSYGGWSYFDGVPSRPDAPDQQANLSATLYAIGALVLAGVAPTDPALMHARGFVERCQAADGGFFFAPAIPDGNKAGVGRAYGTMTADGVRALLRLGVPPGDPRVARGAAWLDAHFDAARNPGDFVPGNEYRRDSAYFYWTWTAAHAMRDLGRPPAAWAPALAEALLAKQRADGSWANGATEMREDDPVVATAFATAALGVCQLALGGTYRSHAAVAQGSGDR
jgi:hypothetical protein